MRKRKRIILTIIGVFFITILIVSLFANSIAKNKIEALINEKIPSYIENSYDQISVNVLSSSVTFKNPSIVIKLKDSSLVQSKIEMNSLKISGVSIWDFLMNNKITIGEINFESLNISHYKDRKNRLIDSSSSTKKPKLPKPIFINHINFNKTSVIIIDKTKDSIVLSFQNTSLNLEDIFLDETTLSLNIPFNYKSVSIEADSIFYKAGMYENLNIDHLNISENTASFDGIYFKTKYSKSELSKIIKKERDHINLKVNELTINHFEFGEFDKDSLFIAANLIIIDQVTAEFYRDKLIADDLKIKPLYSKSLRELPIKLTVDSISILNSEVVYSEKAHIENPAGVLTISSINAGITNISNTYKSPKRTEIIADAVFMKNTPIHIDWSFDVNKLNDSFKFIGQAGKMQASDLNIYLTPLINIELEGEIFESNFSIVGDYNQSEIKLSQDFTNIRLDILNKKKIKNKFLSAAANTFINKDSKEDGLLFHNVTTQATRDKTKSFFNYLSKNLIAGLFVNFTHKNNTVTKSKEKKKSRKKRNKKN